MRTRLLLPFAGLALAGILPDAAEACLRDAYRCGADGNVQRCEQTGPKTWEWHTKAKTACVMRYSDVQCDDTNAGASRCDERGMVEECRPFGFIVGGRSYRWQSTTTQCRIRR